VPWHPTLGNVNAPADLADYQAQKRIHKKEWNKAQAPPEPCLSYEPEVKAFWASSGVNSFGSVIRMWLPKGRAAPCRCRRSGPSAPL